MNERQEEVNALFEALCELSETDVNVSVCIISTDDVHVIESINAEYLIHAFADEQNAYEAIIKIQEYADDAYKNVFLYSQEQMREMLLLITTTAEQAR